ncbi:MAG: hypothetical protein K5639_06735 [Eubacterium sp.]|nr:hypothetical protein [Eubacterium sp.]
MNKNDKTNHQIRTIISGLLLFAMTTAFVPVDLPSVSVAATKKTGKSQPSISASSKGKMLTGESRTLTIKNVKKKSIKKLVVTSSKKSVASVKASGKTKAIIRSKKAGKTTIIIKLILKNKKKNTLKYKATVADTVDRKVKVIKSGGTKSTMKLRYFKDTPHIPYVHITDYYKQLSGGSALKVQKNGTAEYLLTTPKGDTATINTDTDALDTDDYRDFAHVSTPEEGASTINSDYGGAPYLEPLPDEVIDPGKHYTLSYSDYGIDLIGDGNDILLPFETADGLFFTTNAASIAYSGTKLYHYTEISKIIDLNKTDYYDEYLSLNANGKRPADVVDYAYRELMFLMDVQYGNPGKCYFSDAIQKKGMDLALSETDEATQGVKKLLKSRKLVDYLMGLGILQDMLYDGGHTVLNATSYAVYSRLYKEKDDVSLEYYSDLQTTADKIGYKLANLNGTKLYYRDLISDAKGWKDYDYHEQGDTAIYTMNNFSVDADAWKEFYEKRGDIPDDSYGLFIKYLNKASENKAIKNFVIDLTTNSGGDSNVISGMMEIIAGNSCTYIKHKDTGKHIRCPYNVDVNLDGVFDEKDKEVKYPFRFAILTSRYSFSCGNLFPFIAKSHGIMILGEKTYGGSCILLAPAMGDGLPCLISTKLVVTTKDGDDVEKGVTPDKEIEIKTDEDGKEDYSAFFDIPTLSGYINEFYGTKG